MNEKALRGLLNDVDAYVPRVSLLESAGYVVCRCCNADNAEAESINEQIVHYEGCVRMRLDQLSAVLAGGEGEQEADVEDGGFGQAAYCHHRHHLDEHSSDFDSCPHSICKAARGGGAARERTLVEAGRALDTKLNLLAAASDVCSKEMEADLWHEVSEAETVFAQALAAYPSEKEGEEMTIVGGGPKS